MTEQDKRARFFAKTGRLATSNLVEYQAFLWGMEFGSEAEREACAKVCEDQRDLREEARATLKAAEELKSGDEETTLRALRHEGNVRLYHAGIDKCAAAIRARSNAE